MMECIRVTSVWFADWPAAWFYVAAPGLYTTLLYYGLLFAVVSGWFMRPAWRIVKLAVAGIAVVAWSGMLMPELFVTRVTVLPANGGMVVYADAVGRRNDLLVDTGNTNAVQFLTKGFLRGQGVNRLPELALSHGDLKHIGGAGVLAELFPAGRIWTSPVRFRSTAYRRLVARFGEEGYRVETVGRTERTGGWEVLHPERDDRFSRADDGALVLRREIKGTRLLLLNDLGEAGQEKLLQRTQDLRAEIVVAGLPTTGEALGEELLQAIQPELIIVADSEYPAAERAKAAFRERLGKWGGTVIYTRDTGTITIEFRRGKWEVRSVNGGRWGKMLKR